MNEKQKKENWAKIRSTGILRLILEIGILRFALPVTILAQIILYLMEHGFTSSYIPDRFTGPRIISYVLGIVTGGIVFAVLMRVMAARHDRTSLR